MRSKNKKPLHIGRSAAIGIQIGAIIIGTMATITLAVIGFQTYQARTGSVGGEITILPAYAMFFWLGWTANKERQQRKREEARRRDSIPSGSKS